MAGAAADTGSHTTTTKHSSAFTSPHSNGNVPRGVLAGRDSAADTVTLVELSVLKDQLYGGSARSESVTERAGRGGDALERRVSRLVCVGEEGVLKILLGHFTEGTGVA